MSDISERIVVHCPSHEASHYLAAFVAEHQTGDGTVRIALHLPISRIADRRPLIERPVVATFYPLQSMLDLCPTYSVTWLPKGDGPSPEFAGALAVEKGPSDDYFGLVLCGHCEPLCAAGALLDTTHRRRIARVSAHDVLRSIADHIEHAHAHDQAARAGYHPLTHRGDGVVQADDFGRRFPNGPKTGAVASDAMTRFEQGGPHDHLFP